VKRAPLPVILIRRPLVSRYNVGPADILLNAFLADLADMCVYIEYYLIPESNTSHTILDTKNVIVNRVDTVKLVTASGTGQSKLSVIDTREV